MTLALEDRKFVELVYGMFANGEPGALTMTSVALQNLNAILPTGWIKGYSEHFKGLNTVEEQIRFFGSQKFDHEITHRRCQWFLFAAMTRRATRIAEQLPEAQAAAAQLWCLFHRVKGVISRSP